MSGHENRKRRRVRLWRQQEGLCYFCDCPMIHWNDRAADPAKQTPEMRRVWATIDHLRDRHHPGRRDGNPNREQRWVLSCWQCNFERGRQSHMAVPIDQRRAAAQRLPGGNELAGMR